MKTLLIFTAAIVLAFAFNIWLDSGCATQGVITMHGKVCV